MSERPSSLSESQITRAREAIAGLLRILDGDVSESDAEINRQFARDTLREIRAYEGDAMNDEQWSTKAVRDAIRAVVRSGTGVRLLEGIADEQDGGDTVWAEDGLINAVVARLRKGGAS